MPKTLLLTTLALILSLALACVDGSDAGVSSDDAIYIETPETGHIIAQATLTAHYIDAALQAGLTPRQINAALKQIAGSTVIDEFWISDETGQIAFTNIPGIDFAFPTDPNADSQAAPFAALLTGAETVVIQNAQPREADGAIFQYVGVAGIDQPRIVQIGFDRR